MRVAFCRRYGKVCTSWHKGAALNYRPRGFDRVTDLSAICRQQGGKMLIFLLGLSLGTCLGAVALGIVASNKSEAR